MVGMYLQILMIVEIINIPHYIKQITVIHLMYTYAQTVVVHMRVYGSMVQGI